MADFYLWNKDTLVRFAEDASACIAAQEAAMVVQDETIADLEAQVKAVHESWRQALALTVPSATLTLQQPEKTS